MTDGTFGDFAEFDVATVYEASQLDCAVDRNIAAVWQGARVCGPAATVVGHPGDNLALHNLVARADPGTVLVVDVGGHLAGYWGEMLAECAAARGITGLVIDGGVRDTAQIRKSGFPVFARGVSIRRTGKAHAGRTNVPLVLGGVPVEPGDLVMGDDDGLVVVPIAETERVLEAARARQAKEQAALPRLRNGETTLDVFGIDSLTSPTTADGAESGA